MGFGYGPDDGPAHMILKYPNAGGRHQSPVDIETELVEYDSGIHEHPLKIDFKTEQDPEAQNNGHSFVVGITEESTVTGGILGKEEYNLKQFHFHWCSTPNVGSEHTVDGKHYAAEVRDSTSSLCQEKNPSYITRICISKCTSVLLK